MEPVNGGLYQGNSHYKGMKNFWEHGRDSLGLGIRRRKEETCTQFLCDCVSTTVIHSIRARGKLKYCNPLLLNESHFLSPPCL